MMRLFLLTIITLLIVPMSSCSGNDYEVRPPVVQNPPAPLPEEPESSNEDPTPIDSLRLKVTAGNTVLYARLYDNPTTRSFLEILPLTLNAFDRIGLVKSNQLPRQISDAGQRTRRYEKGAVFYWHEGPEVAFCYSDYLPQTVVDIIHIGKIEKGIELFETYTGMIRVEVESTMN